MTNEKKFKTAEERAKAFENHCNSQKGRCNKCILNKYPGDMCRYAWLELEYKEELKPCPFCGREPVMVDNINTMGSLSYYVRCACGVRTVSALKESVAAEIWNKRTK